MNKKILWILTGWQSFILLFGSGQTAFGQTHRLEIGEGRLRFTIFSKMIEKVDRLQYPKEYRIYSLASREAREFKPRVSKGGGFIVAAKDFQAKAFYKGESADPGNWTVEDSLFPYFVVDATSWYTVDTDHSTIPIAPGAVRYWRQRPTKRIVEGKDLSVKDWYDGRDRDDPDSPTNHWGITSCLTAMGITVTERSWVFDNAEFAIVEYVFKYTGNTGNKDQKGQEITYSDPIKDCYVGIKFCPILSNETVVDGSEGWGAATDDWVDYVHEKDGENLRLMYGWDGDASDEYRKEDDEGDPLYFSSGLFSASQYPGMAVLHADKSTNDRTDDQDQPHHFHVSSGGYESDNTLSIGWMRFKDIYETLDEKPNSPSPFDWDGWKAAGRPGNDDQFWTYGTPHATKERRYSQIGTLAFGPYNFDLGDSVQIVLCFTAKALDWETAIDLGTQWKEGSINKEDKNRTLRSVKDSLFTKIRWIKELFEPKFQVNNYDLETTLLDVADEIGSAPAWPDSMVLEPVIGGCRVRWTPVDGASAYRVYRRDRVEFDPDTPQRKPAYSLVYQCGGEDPGGDVKYSQTNESTFWVDEDVFTVFNYWYYVTAVNSDGVESSHFIGRTQPKAADKTYGSIQPFDKEYQNLDNVHVIPNPYNVQSLKLYPGFGEDLVFVGLPASCRIRIFSQNGILVFTYRHESGTELPSNLYEWDLRTETNQKVASGLYIYVIDECKDFNGKEITGTKVDKFVVIR